MIDIWKDPWVPWLPNFIPLPRYDLTHRNLVVACLINQSTRYWNVALLEELFDDASVTTILKIPIPVNPRPDRLAWILNSNGKFSIKSAVRCHQLVPNASTHVDGWTKLWNLNMHERLKMLIWRIGFDILPHKLQFGFEDPLCPVCRLKLETPMHILNSCPAARAIWFGQAWGFRPNSITLSNCLDIVKLVINPPMCSGMSFNKSSKEKVAIQIALTLDYIWSLRNNFVFNGPYTHLHNSLRALKIRVTEHLAIVEEDGRISSAPLIIWKPPPPNIVKFNIDAAVKSTYSSIAVVACDDAGLVLKAWAKCLGSSDPIIVKALAIKCALELAKLEVSMIPLWRVILRVALKLCWVTLLHLVGRLTLFVLM